MVDCCLLFSIIIRLVCSYCHHRVCVGVGVVCCLFVCFPFRYCTRYQYQEQYFTRHFTWHFFFTWHLTRQLGILLGNQAFYSAFFLLGILLGIFLYLTFYSAFIFVARAQIIGIWQNPGSSRLYNLYMQQLVDSTTQLVSSCQYSSSSYRYRTWYSSSS